jgi:hypothetical protein
MYDESIQRAARRNGVRPIVFDHPSHSRVLSIFDPEHEPRSVILTGTAGDGKTHLCRNVWEKLTGDTGGLVDPLVHASCTYGGKKIHVHIIKDLSEWAPQGGATWEPAKEEILRRFCRSIFDPSPSEVFLVAANDGQLIESWRRLADDPYVSRARKVFETLLVEDKQDVPDVHLTFFNLSRGSSAALFDRTFDAFLNHEGWAECQKMDAGDQDFFGANCPIRHNYELFQNALVRKRLRALLELCDFNGLHVPIRQILLLLANGVLGHPDVKDCLMRPNDIQALIQRGTVSKASLYNNIFGGNLPENRRDSITVFDYLDRFRIGHETTNRVDNILIFGDADDKFRAHFDLLVRSDRFYGADEQYRAAQLDYLEGADDEGKHKPFLQQLVSKRRGLFFVIPERLEDELALWELTVFKYAGEYLSRLVAPLRAKRSIDQPIVGRLIRGLNRIFAGMLVTTDRELLLATSLSFSNAKISRLLEDRVSVRPRLHEKVEITFDGIVPKLTVCLTEDITRSLDLHLVRYEFLSRVAEGALPSSFSRECYEDILAFKGQLLAALAERQNLHKDLETEHSLTVRLLNLDDSGNPVEEIIEVMND